MAGEAGWQARGEGEWHGGGEVVTFQDQKEGDGATVDDVASVVMFRNWRGKEICSVTHVLNSIATYLLNMADLPIRWFSMAEVRVGGLQWVIWTR